MKLKTGNVYFVHFSDDGLGCFQNSFGIKILCDSAKTALKVAKKLFKKENNWEYTSLKIEQDSKGIMTSLDLVDGMEPYEKL